MWTKMTLGELAAKMEKEREAQIAQMVAELRAQFIEHEQITLAQIERDLSQGMQH
jgi:predicted transcriptional regulator